MVYRKALDNSPPRCAIIMDEIIIVSDIFSHPCDSAKKEKAYIDFESDLTSDETLSKNQQKQSDSSKV